MPGPLPPKPITPAFSEPMRDRCATEVTAQCGCGPAATGREKYWNELTDSEKIERMRMMVHRAISDIGELEAKVERLSNALLQHTHDPIGRIQVPLKGEDLRPRASKERALRSLGLDRPTDQDFF